MTKFDRGTQKVHGKLSKLSLGFIKGIPFLYFQSKGTEKENIVPFLYLISVWDSTFYRMTLFHILHIIILPFCLVPDHLAAFSSQVLKYKSLAA